jgi:hypothetical protein
MPRNRKGRCAPFSLRLPVRQLRQIATPCSGYKLSMYFKYIKHLQVRQCDFPNDPSVTR